MKVADKIVKFFESKGVEHVFGYPGGAVLSLYESLRTSKIEHILVRNEQSSVHNASGYARASKKVGVCIATSGPGATNLITGIATAYMDSVPMVIITGQVKRTLIGRDSFQEADITGATEPFTKHNYLIKDSSDVLRILKEAFYIASTGRPGPVLIDIASDVFDDVINDDFDEDIELAGYKPTINGHSGQVKKIIKRIEKAKKPVMYVGGGVLLADAIIELKDLIEKTKIPVATTLMGIGAFSMDSECYAGMVGYHGDGFTNKLLRNSDLVIIVGARMSDRATMNFNAFNKNNTDIIHIDIDPAELGKNITNHYPIVGDAKNILKAIGKKISYTCDEEWLKDIKAFKGDFHNYKIEKTETVDPKVALNLLSDLVPEKTIVTADVGKNQIWAAKYFQYGSHKQYYTSGGLGTMGYSLPASIGAALGDKDSTVIAVTGDGGIQMLLGELGTLSESDCKVIVLLFNNNALGMVQELQENKYGDDKTFGIDYKMKTDFVKIANGFNIESERVFSDDKLEKTFKRALESKESFLIECIVDPSYKTL